MDQATATSAMGVIMALALSRPRLGVLVVGPALAAIAGGVLMALSQHVSTTGRR